LKSAEPPHMHPHPAIFGKSQAEAPIRLALFEPDIPQNTGTLMRACACFGVGLDIIEPCGFVLDDKRLRRAAMDYRDHLSLLRHASWGAFEQWRGAKAHRLVLVETDGAESYTQFAFQPGDILVMGRESAGVTPAVTAAAEASVYIPMQKGLRSLNVALAAAMVMGEALRQLHAFANGESPAQGLAKRKDDGS
jgi:tRNA (cytidine/uridine-2'-O-)-methyltransferase